MATTKTMWSSLLRLHKAGYLFALLAAVGLFSTNPASASKNGTLVPDNTFAIGYTYEIAGVPKICSGALLAPTVIVTAAHCVVDSAGNKSSKYVFAAPGVALDAPIDPNVKMPSVVKVFLNPSYLTAESKNQEDIAFVQLDTPLATKGFIRVATPSELNSLPDKSVLTGYGFGDVFENGADYSPFAKSYPLTWNLEKAGTYSLDITSPSAAACLGDSGGPITFKLSSGEEVLVAVLDSAAEIFDHCGSAVNGIYSMKATSVYPYLNLVSDLLKVPSLVIAPKPAAKKYKITCLKLKTKKYVTGTNPRCPAGYKQISKVPVSR